MIGVCGKLPQKSEWPWAIRQPCPAFEQYVQTSRVCYLDALLLVSWLRKRPSCMPISLIC